MNYQILGLQIICIRLGGIVDVIILQYYNYDDDC